MGCLMNVLWLVFGGILTAVEYMIASLLMMITIVGISFRYANNEDGGVLPCGLSAKRFVVGNVPTVASMC